MNSVHESPNGKVVWVILFAQEPCAWRVSWPVKCILCLGFCFSFGKSLRSCFGFCHSLFTTVRPRAAPVPCIQGVGRRIASTSGWFASSEILLFQAGRGNVRAFSHCLSLISALLPRTLPGFRSYNTLLSVLGCSFQPSYCYHQRAY